MKIATLKDGSRDGQLVIVSRDLALAQHASAIATRLQQVLDDWNFLSPQLEEVYATLNAGRARHAFAFDPRQCMAPLPRCFEWVCSGPAATSALQTGSGNAWLGPHDELLLADAGAALHGTPGLAAITGDIARGADAAQAVAGVRLLMLVKDWALRRAGADGQVHEGEPAPARLATAAGPVAVTPDELGTDWRDGRVLLPLRWRAERQGRDADAGTLPSFGELLAQAARDRALHAGCVVGSLATPPGEPAALGAGERVRVELRAPTGHALLGTIEQHIVAAQAKGQATH